MSSSDQAQSTKGQIAPICSSTHRTATIQSSHQPTVYRQPDCRVKQHQLGAQSDPTSNGPPALPGTNERQPRLPAPTPKKALRPAAPEAVHAGPLKRVSEPQAQRGKNNKARGAVVQADRRSAPLAYSPGECPPSGDSVSFPGWRESAQQREPWPRSTPRHEAAGPPPLSWVPLQVQPLQLQGGGMTPTLGTPPPMPRYPASSVLTGEMCGTGPSRSRASQSAGHLAGWLAPPRS
ncbi:hypothetical protein NDU88_002225 [Pleurodeles waltl]|uniref:Uncharacterized protein n=1 Tax=Pleurodeles waltl TaxID=8319 RepID=A0AAV7UV35_PLEWA|nr:hypothetical protein NDU88_002225 [Pleurodeles waltl]